MANQVKIDLSVQDTGNTIKKRTSETQALNKELTRSQQLATGTQTGSRAVRASYSAAAAGDSEGTEYGRARGSMGATGAGARDFANQSQGLGGLVRLYATYAANVFAVSAAFNALSQAMNTTNMVQGLNQLGAASGIAMGNLAKQFEQASGGAISLRESMEATAKAVSSGLSQAQFLKLGEVAKKASQALGVNMSDAVSRLTRGITKLEPELLDELGIFTKVGKATEDYAQSVGKSVSSLTDFERRQAFANAVLSEGAQKFGEIDIPTNPYDKLLSSLKNVAQSILEVVNKALVPLVDLLSASPTALLAAIAAIGLKITTQALPAITQYRAGLKQAAEEAQQLAELRSKAAKEAYEKAAEPAMQRQLSIRAEAYLKKEEALSKLTEKSERAASSGRLVKEFRDIMSTKDVNLIKDEDIAKIDAHGKSLKRSTNLYTEWAREAMAAKNAAQQFDKELAKTPDVTKARIGSAADIALRREAAAVAGAKTRGIVSQASIDTEVQGATVALSRALDAIKTEKLGTVRSIFTGVSAAATIATTKIIGLASAFGNLFGVVGILITAYQMFTSFFGKNSKEAEKAKSSIDTLEGSIDSVALTIDRLNKKPILESLTPQALSAKATAFSTLTDALSQALDDVEKEIQNRNAVDIFSNWISGIFGKNTEERIAEQLTNAIDSAFKVAATATQADDVRKYLALSLSIPVESSLGEIKKAAEKATPAIRKEVAKVLDGIGKGAERSSGSVKGFIDSLTESNKLYQDLGNSFKASDPVSKFADESSKKIAEFSKVLDTADLPSKLALLTSASTDARFLQLLPLDQAKQILAEAQNLKQINSDIAQGLSDIKALEDGRLLAQQKLDNTVANSPIVPQLQASIKAYDKLIDQSRKLAKSKESEAAIKLLDVEKTFTKAIGVGLIANIDRFQSGLEVAAKKARLELEKINLQGIVDPRRRIEEAAKIDKTAVELDNQQIRTQISLIESNDKLRLAIQEQTYYDKVRQKMQEFGVKTELEARARDPQLEQQFRVLEVAQNIQGKTIKQLRGMLQSGVSSDVMSAVQAALPTAQAVEGSKQKLAENATRKAQIDLNKQYSLIDAETQAAMEQYKKLLEDLDRNKPGMTESEFIRQKAGIEAGKSLVTPSAELRKAELRGPQDAKNIAEAQRRLDVERNISNEVLSRAMTSADELDSLLSGRNALKESVAEQAKTLDIEKYSLEYKQQSLQQDLERGKITQDQFNSTKYLLDLEQAELTKSNALLSEQESYINKILEIRTKIAEQGGLASPEQIRALNDARVASDSVVDSINRQYDSTKSLLDLNKQLSQRQTAYTDLFKQAFKGMEDAIVEFTKTGKLSFSSMIDSFLEGLLRYEIQQQQTALFKSVGGFGGLGTMLANFMTPTPTNAQTVIPMQPGGGYAKGGAFDYGIEAFAKGGMFTNSIVDSPTLFKFAKGTGLMGEAGPEAIMPLTRDSSGNLGVRTQGGGGNVEVVVNNFGSEKATAKETTDSRGNRRIEVVIGDMVAQEVSRTGSATQNALSSTYGNRPALARR